MMSTHRNYIDLLLHGFLVEWQHPEQTLDVIDVGCGNTHFKSVFEQYAFKWAGIDRSGRDKIETGLMEDLPRGDNSVDVYFSSHAFEHSEDPIKTLREALRVLRPGGRLCIVTPSPCYHQIISGDSDHVFVLNQLQMRKLLQYVGFEEIECFVQMRGIEREQDWNVWSIGVKPK